MRSQSADKKSLNHAEHLASATPRSGSEADINAGRDQTEPFVPGGKEGWVESPPEKNEKKYELNMKNRL